MKEERDRIANAVKREAERKVKRVVSYAKNVN